MSREEAAEKILTVAELTREIAEATGTTPDEIERGASDLEIAPPTESDRH